MPTIAMRSNFTWGLGDVQRGARLFAMAVPDVRADQSDSHRHDRGIVGEADTGDKIRDDIEGQDEVSQRRQQHGPYLGRRLRIDGAEISRCRILRERYLAGNPAQLGPEAVRDDAFVARENRRQLGRLRIGKL